jgi:tRNA(Arg) A34 adenosine deaminase TadA
MPESSAAQHARFLQEAIALARQGMRSNSGGPFGAVIVQDSSIIGRGWNQVTSTNDPTAHAEIVAIREACQQLRTFQLAGSVLYASCEPCPMCLAAIYWARIEGVHFAAAGSAAAAAGFDDEFIRRELLLPLAARRLPLTVHPSAEAAALFEEWRGRNDKIPY